MTRRTYIISGFDCANCAHNSEVHLNKHPLIESAVIDFAGDRLHIVFKDEEMSISQILEVIKEVEEDPVEIKEIKDKKSKYNVFNKDFFVLLVRILFAIIVILLTELVLKDEQYFYIALGLNVVAIIELCYDIFIKVFKHIIHKENPIDEYLLITMAVIGAFIVASISKNTHDYFEAIMVAMLFQIGQLVEAIATNKSKEAISTAISTRVEVAFLCVDDAIKEVSPDSLKVGDVVMVKSGDLIPVDGKMISGEGLVDTSSLTGEFVPIKASVNDHLYAGCLLKEGTIYLEVEKEYKDSAVARIEELIANSGAKKSKAEEFVTKFARWYTPTILLISILIGVIGGAITQSWNEWIILGLKMLVVACPCAIVISVPLAYFSAIGLASKNGIVVKGANYLEELNRLKKLVTDKTGTLTKGQFKVNKIHALNGDEEELISLVYAAESHSNHPIAKTICEGQNLEEISKNVSEFVQEAGLGVSIMLNDESVIVGNAKMMQKYQINFEEVDEIGVTIYVAKNQKYVGYVVLSDEIREETEESIKYLKDRNIEVILLTGDKENNARKISEKLGIDRYYSELFPEQKVELLEKELSKDYATAFVGDGINDAASIKEADIGIAMGGIGSDIAVENADIVLMKDSPMKICDSIKIAKIARNVSIFNVAFALFIKFSIEVLAVVTNLIGHPDFVPMWLAVIADTGLTVVLVINAMLILYRKIRR